jgi:hypothetical protein
MNTALSASTRLAHVTAAAVAAMFVAASAGASASDPHPAYCVDRPSCASHLIWKRSEAWSGFQASAGIQGGQTDGFPWADVALGVGLACACALTLVGGICLRERSRARSHLLRSG